MTKRVLFVLLLLVLPMLYYVATSHNLQILMDVPQEQTEPILAEEEIFPAQFDYTERYSARIDRVEVIFEHREYTQYQLTTNGRIQTGDLNTERGFETDEDATVYVLNWQKPAGEQILYVRLTAEPGRLYLLDSERKIVRGSVLALQP